MAFIPYESVSYKTKLEYNEIIKRIQDTIEPKKIIRLIRGNSTKPYEGKLKENYFEMNRIISFSNVFSPVICGTIEELNDEIKIDIKLKPHARVIAVMVIWLGFVGYIFFSSLFNYFINSISDNNLFTSLLALIVGYIIMIWSFKSEGKREKNRLMELFEVKNENE